MKKIMLWMLVGMLVLVHIVIAGYIVILLSLTRVGVCGI